MELFDIKDLSFTYALSEKPAIRNVSLSIGSGDFVLVCGATGCGKSTLLRLLKPELEPAGTKSGLVSYCVAAINELSQARSAAEVSFVMQNIEYQIITDKVWHELAFTLENLGYPRDLIARRIAETAQFFGIGDLIDRNVAELSGGQKQLLSLAAAMTTDPKVLILDEPTAELDPVSATAFINCLKKLNEELSVTVVIAEHRIEELLPLCTKLVVLGDGAVCACGSPQKVLSSCDLPAGFDLPAAVMMYRACGEGGACPFSVREGRSYLREHFSNSIAALESDDRPEKTVAALEFSNVSFRYERNGTDVLKDLNLKVYAGEIFCLLGGNGSGKTTLIGNACARLTPYAGRIRVFGKKLSEYKGGSLFDHCIAVLPQNVRHLFVYDTVGEELKAARREGVTPPYDLSAYEITHPYDLSGGEQQLLALCKVLASRPKLLFLDEPTKGLDKEKKELLKSILNDLRSNGVTAVIVTHDVDFAAQISDRCALLFHGRIAACESPEIFFDENKFYTTSAARIAKDHYKGAVTVDRLVRLCKLNRKDGDGHV